ncbi:MAG: T9SS type A sorting domain-containing protein, partial [Bacteroidota bacterium]
LNGLFELAGGSEQGWTGSWQRAIGDDAILRRGNLEVNDFNLGEDGTRASLEFIRAGIRYNRRMERLRDDGQEIWASVIMDWRPTTVGNNVGNVTLTRNNEQVLSFGRKFGNRRIAIVLPGGVSFETSTPAEGRHLLLLKIEMSGDGGTERAFLWVDPPLEQPTGGPDVVSADAATPTGRFNLNDGIDGVQLKVEGTPPLAVEYDRLVIGGSFRAVLPGFTVANANREQRAWQFYVLPNPTAGAVTVNWTSTSVDNYTLALYDAGGRLLRRFNERRYPAGPQSQVLDLAALGLPAGTYFLRLRGDGGVATQRVVLQ